jgi:hypothetical protein
VDAGGDPKSIKITKEATLCGSCHIRGAKDKIPASKGFIRHHEQYNELLASPHKNIKCITCHNPHLTAQRGIGIKASCNSCHRKDAKAFEGSQHSRRRIKCEDCHMAPAAKSAVALGKYEGDIKSHSMMINIDPNAPTPRCSPMMASLLKDTSPWNIHASTAILRKRSSGH